MCIYVYACVATCLPLLLSPFSVVPFSSYTFHHLLIASISFISSLSSHHALYKEEEEMNASHPSASPPLPFYCAFFFRAIHLLITGRASSFSDCFFSSDFVRRRRGEEEAEEEEE